MPQLNTGLVWLQEKRGGLGADRDFWTGVTLMSWRHQNDVVFEGVAPFKAVVISKISDGAELWRAAGLSKISDRAELWRAARLFRGVLGLLDKWRCRKYPCNVCVLPFF
jgi:hypothetical protein